jgi:2-(1,2-epoxy-1,2-dihydrophenyl)acetyl-CoA isomerase
MAASQIDTRREGAVGVITINRPARFNALDVQTAQDFRRAGLLFARDPAVRAVIIAGLPGMFCSGADLKFIRDGGDPADLGYLVASPSSESAQRGPTETGVARPVEGRYGQVFKQILEYIHSTISEVRRAPKPFIAAVDGMAAAGGFGIAMCCDLVFASTRATFEWAYGKTALTGAESATFMLPKLVGLRRASELMLLNPRLSARDAREYGLVTAVYDHERFDAEVMTIAQRLADGPTHSFAIAKELLNQAAGMDRLDAHLDRELDELSRVADTPEFAEGLRAFFEKRTPDFASSDPRRLPGDEPRHA